MTTMAEKKFFDIQNINPVDGTNAPTQFADTNWYFISFVNAIAQGFDASTRVGNKIFVRYVQVTISFVSDSDLCINGNWIRYVVVHNKDTNGTLVTGADLFSPSFAQYSNTALRNYTTMNKYRILLDRQFAITTMAYSGTTNVTNPCGVTQHYIPVNKQIDFRTSGTNPLSAANLISNDIDIGFCAAVKDCCSAKVSLRVVYNDM